MSSGLLPLLFWTTWRAALQFSLVSSSFFFSSSKTQINRKLPPLAVPLNTHARTHTYTHISHMHTEVTVVKKYTKKKKKEKCPFFVSFKLSRHQKKRTQTYFREAIEQGWNKALLAKLTNLCAVLWQVLQPFLKTCYSGFLNLNRQNPEELDTPWYYRLLEAVGRIQA